MKFKIGQLYWSHRSNRVLRYEGRVDNSEVFTLMGHTKPTKIEPLQVGTMIDCIPDSFNHLQEYHGEGFTA